MSFVEKTRQNILPLTTLSYESGVEKSYDISRVGFLSKITLRFSGNLKCKHASKTTFQKAFCAPFNLAKRTKLVLNNGVSLWNTSGMGAYLQNLATKYDSKMDLETEGSRCFRFGNKVSSTGADNPIDFSIDLKVATNDRDALGLVMLQSSQVVATVHVENDAPGVLMTDTDIESTLTGNWYITVEHFDIPVNVQDWPALNNYHQVLEDQQPIPATGSNRFTIPRGNTYMRIINSVLLNGQPNSEDVERLSLKYNLTSEPYNIYAQDLLSLQRTRYGRDLPEGVFVWDFDYQGVVNLGMHRDFVYSGNITEFDQYLHIASGAELGSNNNKLLTVRDMLVSIQ